MQRIGVFVCWCGSNIAATVDVEAVAEALSHEAGVVFSTNYQYMCSQAGQELIQNAIHEHKLTGVVICSCSPRMHENTFRKTCERAGINPYMVEIANIREQCSWIHKDKAVGTEKAIILGRAAIAKVLLNAPLTAGTSPVVKRALVIGGGIAGIQTALDIADAGFPVDIVEKEPTIGGKMTQIDKTFPTLDCAACILTPKMVDAAQNENIKIYSYSQVEAVKGFVGNFTVTIRRKARYVDEEKCTGCGLCTEKCPQKKVPNAFNLGLDTRRAIYIPFAQAVPKIATIDADYCTMLKTGKCGVCSKVCTAGAIDYKQQDSFVEEQYGAIVVATGYNPIKLDRFDEFAYSQSPDVVTSLELERLMNAAGPNRRHPAPSLGQDPSPYPGLRPVRRLPVRRRREGQALLLQDLLHVHRQARHADPGEVPRIPRSMSSISTSGPPARTSTSSTAGPWRSTASTTSRAWSARSRPRTASSTSRRRICWADSS